MDRELPQEYSRRRKRILIFRIISGIVALVVALWLLRIGLNPALRRSQIRIATAEIGEIEDVLSAQGIVIPEFEKVITSPIESKILQIYLKTGEQVPRGTAILELDRTNLQAELDQQNDELALKINRKTQLQLTVERSLIDLKSQHDIKELRIRFLESRFAVQEQLLEIGVGIQEEMDQARLNLEIAQRELQQLEEHINNAEKSLISNLTELDLDIQIQKKTVNTLIRQLQQAEARSDRDGVLTWVPDDIGASVQPGEVIARIADLNSYLVEARISEIHAACLETGMPVKVEINEEYLGGRISSINPKIENGIITFMVELDEKTDTRLRHNLRTDVSVITERKNDIVRLKNGPFVNGPGIQDIFVVRGNLAQRRTVRIGSTNLDFVEVLEGLQAGEQVIISDMEHQLHRREISFK